MINRRWISEVRHTDAVSFLASLPAGSVGAVVTDPPFFVGMGRKKNEGGVGADPWVGKSVSDVSAMIEYYKPIAAHVARVLRPGGASVVMGGSHSTAAWEVAAEKAGLPWMAEITVLWNQGKPRLRNFGSLSMPIKWHVRPGARHTFNVGQAKSIYSNVVVATKVPIHERIHVAQKPVELTNFLISLLSNEDDLIVDPFCGSGSTLVSAAMCGRRWLGCDLDKKMCDHAATRAARHELEEADLRPLYLWTNGRMQEVAA